MLSYSLTLLRRRLWVVILAFALSAVAASQVLIFIPPVQESTASVLFIPSAKEPGVEDPTNPLLSLGGSVAIVASVVQVAVTDDQTEQKLVGDGSNASYTVVPDLGENAGPILQVTADSKDPARSQQVRDEVVAEIQRELVTLQSSQKVPSDLQVSTLVLTSSPTPTLVRKTQIQLGVAVLAVTLLLLLGLILLVEHRSSRRREGRFEADLGHEPPTPDADAESGRRMRRHRSADVRASRGRSEARSLGGESTPDQRSELTPSR